MVKDMLLTKNGKLLGKGGKSLSINSEDRELVYHTNFANFDISTYTDYPEAGVPSKWTCNRGSIVKTIKTIDGVTYPCLYLNDNTSLSMSQNLLEKFPDCFSVEFTTYKDSYSGLAGGTVAFCVRNPCYNCWSSGRGISIWPYRGSIIQRYNGFYHIHDGYQYADYYNHRNVSQIITGGMTVLKNQNLVKCYLAGKKGLLVSVDPNDSNWLCLESDNNSGSQFYVLDMKIYTTDRFEEMQ